MTSPDLETAAREFMQKQRRVKFTLLIVMTIVLAATIATFAYLSSRTRQAEDHAKDQSDQLAQLAAEAHLRQDLRTERPLDRAEILQRVSGDLQKRVIGTAIDLYEQKPPISYTWGGKSPKTGFDSSGYVAYALAQAGVLQNPGVYWSGRLKQFLKPVPIEKKQPGDVIFFPGGACMFFLGGPDDLAIGALPGGLATGKLDQVRKPEAAGRY
jgi:cell wall-associated NlpC family hydrolase